MKIEPATATYPLSPMQQGMLFHSMSARQPGVDVEQIFCTLHEEVNAAVFQLAWRRVIERHAVLRTSFHWQESTEPLQKVHQHVDFEFSRQNWRDVSEAKRKKLFTGWLEAERTRGFDLGKAPLMRLALFRHGEKKCQFLWTFHHLLLDGRAVVTLLNEVFAFYEAFNAGEDLELPPPCPYHDFIYWLQEQDLIKAEDFWRQTLKGFSAPTPLVVASRTNNEAECLQIRGEQQFRLSGATTTALKLVAKENRLTLNTLTQGAWALLLSRYSGEEDVMFGAVRASRHATVEGAESIVGLCINTVPVRVRAPAGERLLPWLAGLRNTWIALRDYEHTPLVKIQGWSEMPPGQPLFESIFNFQDPSWDTALCAQGGKWATRQFGICSQSNYPLVVDAYGGDAMLIKILYHRTRFDDASIERMLGHFKTLLEGMVENPNQQLSDLPLLTEVERRQLLVEWNDTGADFPKDKCVHQLFEEQVERTPDGLAVADKTIQLTYRELNDRANLLASKLREMGVCPGVCVGICMERCVEMVASKLAVWKAGGAYVPLDPSYPEDRLAFMLQDAKMPVLLTRKSLRENFKFEISNLKMLCVDTPLVRTGNETDESIPQSAIHSPQPKNLAYVIYTSGSTGTPKGVEVEHASLVNLITWHQRIYSVTPADRATQIATPAFDASIWELWPYLTAGASVHIPDEETRFSARQLLRWLADKKVTLTFIPTPIAENMLDEPWPENCAVRAVLTGGDKLHRVPGKDFPCALLNHYGPTENTVVTTWSSVPPVDANHKPPPIGRPIANTQVYILDRNLQPVPIGVPGELHISGVGLARGYHNHPELTAEKFIPNPFSAESNLRLYKTGDFARWLPDGQIEFLGRMDNQVKIRGQRIELGEIETILVGHPDVQESAVVPRENTKGENRLVAYVVPKAEIKTGELRRFLQGKLPAAMVPSAFVCLNSLPLTPNGKIDHQALPSPDFTAELENSSTTPRTPTEETLAGIWGEVLGLRHISIHGNFFELGGHSLVATQVISRIFNAFQIEMPLHELFDSPTIAGLAEKIDAACKAMPSPASSQKQSERNGRLPVSFAQERLWFMEQLEPGQPFNNIPVALQLKGALNISALKKSVTEIIRRHATLRTAFGNENGYPVAVVTPAKEMEIPVVDLSAASGGKREAEARQLISAEAQQPFDLARGPLLRVKLLRFAAEEHLLLFTMHHIACDGWSMGVFYRELAALYEAFSQGWPSPLPELEFDYFDFACSQRERLQDETLEKKLAHWKQQLAGAQTTLDLPTDRPRPPVQTYHGATKHFALPKDLSEQLAHLSRKENVTPFMLLLATFQTLLHRYSGQEDILVGSPVAGRTRVESEDLIGFFVNTLVLRGGLSGDPPFRELLKRTRKAALNAFAHPDLPFEKLVDALQPTRDLSRSPLFQAMFVLQNQPLYSLDLAGLKLTPLPLHNGTAKFDLMLSLEERAGSLSGFIEYNTDLFNAETITQLLGNYQTLLESILTGVEQRLSQLPLLTEAGRKEILIKWNDTGVEFPKDKCVHQLFEEQVERTPDAVAVVFEDEQLTYRELNGRANQLAHKLQELGVGPDMRVGICVKRSLEMLVGLLGILKAGGCYVPLDPVYPKERLAFMLEDSQAPVLLTQESLRDTLKFDIPNLKIIGVDPMIHDSQLTIHGPNPQSQTHSLQSGNLAYVIYTSGSTGRPKGVMVTHRNVVNFFAGMDRVLGTEPGIWLAVTSISFDISVLELFWTLVRGFKVVIQPDNDHMQIPVPDKKSADRKIDFSLFYFASDDGKRAGDKYRLLTEGAKFADEHGFTAVWTPERHFHSFGAPYPNASITGAAIAMVTKRIQIRAGSVVLPLHHPLRVAEEWSVVDNLSNGRVAISFASGWHDRDFALAPENYGQRKEILFAGIETVRKLWRGESLRCRTGGGKETEIKTFPRPVQKELPVWITASSHPETFRKAGELGANLLTHLLGQNFDELAGKIRTYRAARAEHHDSEGRVTLMLHTFVGTDLDYTREKIRKPLCDYLKSSADLLRSLAHGDLGDGIDFNNITGKELDALAQRAFDRYFTLCGLLGTPESCLPSINRLKAIGVDEVACLIDFGVDEDSVIASLPDLNRLKELSNPPATAKGQWRSIPEQILRHNVTHMQCTPSLAGTLVLAPESLAAMRRLDKLLLGGEALPVSLSKQLREILRGDLVNMYGPTETTVWSAAYRVDEAGNSVPIGRPIANTQIYILDKNLQPVPAGVPGEIFIGGEGVARGYLNRPELTAEKFIRDSFSTNANARIYCTGDLGRFRAGGAIEFLGRLDHQVKIRGHRIELGEIELALGRHPGVREIVVAAHEDTPGDKRLVAYVVAAPDAKPSATELRRFAQEKLPGAMTPDAFVFLDTLPLTPNGKVNRKALPAGEVQRPQLETTYVAPQSKLEKSIAKIWQELLRLNQAGLHDNFFDLGGNSLLVVQAQARLRDTLGFDLPVVKLFQHPTIGALANFLSVHEPPSFEKVQHRARRKQTVFAHHTKREHEVMR